MICYKISFPILFACSFSCCIAQQKNFTLKQLTSENGLSDNRITAIQKDSLGFIWIGTKDGLNRYDGREFYAFRNDENDSTTLGGNRITSLAYSPDSLLWFSTSSSGFGCYDFRTGRFANYNKGNSALFSNSINAIDYEQKTNRLWVSQNNAGLQVFDVKKRVFMEPLVSIPKSSCFDVAFFENTIYTVGISISLHNLKHPQRKAPNHQVSTLNNIFFGSDNHIWCGAWNNTLNEFDMHANFLNSYIFDGKPQVNFSGDEILAIVEGKNQLLWCASKNSGIHFFDLKTKSFTNEINLLPQISSRINTLFKDEFERIWIGSETGLFLYDPLLNQFNEVHIVMPYGISSCKVFGRAITKGKKDFLITACGLYYKNSHQKEYNYKSVFYKGEKQKLTSIYKDAQERIFIGSNRTLFLLDTNSFELTTIPSNAKLSNEHFYNIEASQVNEIASYIHHSDTLIAASFYGHFLSLIDFSHKNIFYLKPVQKATYENLNRKILVDSKNNFWICGASQGVSKIEIPDSIRFNDFAISDTVFRSVNYVPKSWANKKSGKINSINDVFDMIEEADGSYWLSTQGQGLVKFFPDHETQPFVSYADKFKSLHGLIKSDDNNIWIISSLGLLNFNIKSNHYTIYNNRNGVKETIGGYFFYADNNELNFGFDGGYYSFNPRSILINNEKPRLRINQLWVMDVTADSLLLKEKIVLPHNRNFLKFYVSANCFSVNEQVTYNYMLEGVDDAWRNNQNNPLIIYTNLPSGNFVLKVKAVNSDGIESDQIHLPVRIIPPFYQTIYFCACVIVSLAGAAYALYRYRIKQILKLQEVRNKIARDLHDDIGSTLGSINLYSQIANVKLDQKKPEEIKDILHKIGASSREIIDKTSDAVWTVKASNDTLRNLILRMESYAASLLGSANIHFAIDYDESNADVKLEMNLRKNIFLIFKEAINNSIKYANCTEVTICIKKVAGKIQVKIKDNGKGFNETEINPYNGNGIKNMKERAHELGGTFLIISERDKGTIIEIVV